MQKMALFRPLLVLLLALTANASTVSVQPGECTLQSAVDMASSGDILLLADGTFTCGTNANVVSVSKTLTIKGIMRCLCLSSHGRGAHVTCHVCARVCVGACVRACLVRVCVRACMTS